MAAYEQEILRKLGEMEREQPHEPTAPPLQNVSKARTIKKLGQEAKRQALYRMSGVDITQIDAIGVETVEVIVSEYGSDLSRFPTEKQFISHVTLAPSVPKSGGKPVRKKSGTAQVRGSRLPCVWRRSLCATARLLSELTIEESHNDGVETLPFSPPLGS